MSLPRWILLATAFAVPASAQAQWAQVTILSPANGAHVINPTITVSYNGCSTVVPTSYGVFVNGAPVATTVTTARCPDWAVARRYSASVTLQPGANGIRAEVCHSSQFPTCISRGITVYYDTPRVSVTPDGGTGAAINDGAGGSYGFTVTNNGDLGATANLSSACAGNVVGCWASPASVYLTPGASSTVTVTYGGSGVGSGTASLTALYAEYPSTSDGGWVGVVVNPKPVARVTVVNNGAGTIGVGQTSSFTARTYAGDGSELAGRSISWSGSNVSVSPSTGTSAATTTATGTAAGAAAVYAMSEGVTGGAGITVVNPTYSVSVTSSTSNPLNTPAGATSTGVMRYFVTNTSTYTSTASTFALSASRSGVVASCPALGSVTLAPGQSSDPITVSCTLSGVTAPASGTVTVTASTTSPVSFGNSFTHTVNATPYYAVRVTPTVTSRTEPARATSGSTTFTVYNDSKGTGGTTVISLSRSCTGVAACPRPGGNVTVAEGGSTVVTVSYDVLWVGTTGSVAVTAAAGGASASGSTSIGTTPSYSVSVTPAAAAQTLPARTVSASPSFTVRNTSTNSAGAITLALTASCSGIASCVATQGDRTIAQDAQVVHAVNTTIALSGRTGGVSLTASASAPASISASASTSLTATPAYVVAVVPAEPSKTLSPRSTLDSTYFRVENRSSNTNGEVVTFDVSVACSGVASCSAAPATVSLAENGVSGSRRVGFGVSHVGATGTVVVTASAFSPTSFSGSGSSAIKPTPSYTVSVTSASLYHTLPAQSTSGNASYTVENTSTNIAGPITFSFRASCTGVTSCAAGQDTASIAQGASSARSVSFVVDSAGTTGSVELTAAAASPGPVSGSGATTIHTTPFYRVAVTPDSASQTLAARAASGSSSFKVKNTSWNIAGPIAFALTRTCSGIARSSGCSGSPASVTLAQDAQSADVSVTYLVDSVGADGAATLTASASSPSAFSGSGTTRLVATPSYSVAVTPAAATQSVGAGTTQTFDATIRNTSWNTAAPISVSLSTPGCSNVTVGSCEVPANTGSIAQGESTPSIPLTYDALAVGNETVALSVTATVNDGTVAVTNGSLTVAVSASGIVTVTTAGLNPGTTVDRGDCLTIAAGQDAAYECGDLRIVHPLPTTNTMGQARTPALVFNSRHAKPGALLAANVHYTGPQPLALQATVTIPSQAPITRTFTWDPGCENHVCRIVVPIDATATMATGLYAATIQVKATTNGFTYGTSAAVTDTVVIVNRSRSPFGAGWWLDGLETLVHLASPQLKLWLGGDGSSRLYTQNAEDPTVFTVSPAYDRPDVLKQVGTSWRRLLDNGAYVEFDNAGRHRRTVNALGWETRFAYKETVAGTPLDSIVLPVPSASGAARAYAFSYELDGSGEPALSAVVSPAASFARTTTVVRASHFWVTGVTDPDGRTTTFGYDSPGRLTRRQNKLTDTTYFVYDGGGALQQVTLGMSRTDGAGAAITTTFRAAETRSVYNPSDRPTPLAKAYTWLDGPRADVGDTTTFLVNRWGAPDTVVNALGHRTRVRRDDPRFPALVTTSFGPTNLESRAYYNPRGLLDSTEVLDPYGRGCAGVDRSCNAITRYAWHPVWNHVQVVIGPTTEQTTTFYDADRPLADSIQVGHDPARRVRIRYHASGQVASVAEPGLGRDSIVYDGLGNVAATVSPLGFVTEHLRDAIGRDTLVTTPTDTAQTASLRTRTRTIYNAHDLVDSTVAIGAAVSYALHFTAPDTAQVTADTLFTTHRYDPEGRLTGTTAAGTARSPTPEDPVVRVTEQLGLDAAGRVRRRAKNSSSDSTYYDEAGNVRHVVTGGGGGYTQEFDALNRVSRRIVAAKRYPRQRCEGMLPGSITGSTEEPASCLAVFPAYPTASDGSYTIRGDTALFTYDTLGNIVVGVNGDARIQRAYFRNGALKRDSMAYRAVNGSWLTNPKVIQYSYDLSGRRDTLTLPGDGKITYGYRPDDGALLSILDPRGTQYRFVYTLAGQVDSLVVGADAIREKRWYDAEGRQYERVRERDDPDPAQRILSSEVLTFDARGRVTRSAYWTRANLTGGDTTYFTYSGLGAVLVRERTVADPVRRWEVEEFRVDGLGNVLRTKTSVSDQRATMPQVARYSPRGALTGRAGLPNPEYPYEYDELKQGFDRDGQQVSSHHYARDFANTPTVDNPTRSYYGADGKLRAVQRHVQLSSGAKGTWEEYRYDALGRRVTVIARPGGSRHPGCDTLDLQLCAGLCTVGDCTSKVTTVVWDGNQVVREEREPYPGGNWTSPYYGEIEYVHGPQLDKPLATLENTVSGGVRVLNPNWRGLFESSVTATGAGADCSLATGSCTRIAWPAGQPVYERPLPLDLGGMGARPIAWAGTLLTDGQDGTGQLYRRNRYYDPDAGRFTQEDPIGLAGGMNLYGFAGGDPVNYEDPFGLCPSCVGALTGVATGWAIAKLSGQEYAWKSALADATLGAVGAGLATKAAALGGLTVGVGRVAEHSGGKVVIGETMRRVREYAGKVNAETFETVANTPRQMWKENSSWLRRAMREGKEIVDVGEDPGRAVRSRFYQAEKQVIERRSYLVTRDPQP